MLKVTYLFIVSSLLLMMSTSLSANEIKENNSKSELMCIIEQACSVENGDFESESNPTFAEGYNDGVKEGKRLRAENNTRDYQAFLNSYSSYSVRFPDLTQNHDYFEGKYLGLIQGWQAESPGSGGLKPVSTPKCGWVGDNWVCEDLD